MQTNSTILIVDDKEANLMTLEALLAAQDYELLFAKSGAEALDMLAKNTVDLVLLDVMMPDMDGYEVCQHIRLNKTLAEIPIIMVTALNDRDSRLKGIEVGADDFISKPFDKDELRTRVKSVTRLNRYRKILEQTNRVAYLESYDPITGLPNRNLLLQRLALTIQAENQQTPQEIAFLCIGLDNFTAYNDKHGLAVGDQLLKEAATRLAEIVDPTDTVAKLGDDKFAAFHRSDNITLEDAIIYANRIRDALDRPFLVGSDKELSTTVTIGISLYPSDADDPQSLLTNSNAALTYARTLGVGGQEFFSMEMKYLIL